MTSPPDVDASGRRAEFDPAPGVRRALAVRVAALIALATVPYLPTLRGPFFWDDTANVEFNRALRTPAGLRLIWTDPLASFQYYPLTYSLFWIEYQTFGERPFGYHVVNLALHAVNAILVWRALLVLKAPASWWAATLFAVHPIQVETVGWISEQKNLLSTLFALGVLLAWESFATKGRGRWLAASTLAFVAALAAKTAVVVLPVYLVLSEAVRRRARVRRWLPPLVTWLLIGVAAGLVTSWRETASSVSTGSPADTPPLLRIDVRLLLVAQSLWRYVAMLCCLEPFVPIPVRSVAAWGEPSSIASLVGTAVVVAAALTLVVNRRPGVFLGLAFFAIQLGPTLGLIRFQFQCHSFVADHFAYFACVGFFAVACGAWFRDPAIWRRLVGGGVLLVLVALTWRQSALFSDPVRLWKATAVANPQAWAAYVNLSDLLLKRGGVREGLEAAQRAVEVEPTAAMGHHNLGMALSRLGRPREAERAFREALRFMPDDPRFRHNLGNVLAQQERWREAVEEYQRAADRAPDFPMTHYLMGLAFRKLEMNAEARAAFERALAVDPSLRPARTALEELERGVGAQSK